MPKYVKVKPICAPISTNIIDLKKRPLACGTYARVVSAVLKEAWKEKPRSIEIQGEHGPGILITDYYLSETLPDRGVQVVVGTNDYRELYELSSGRIVNTDYYEEFEVEVYRLGDTVEIVL